MAPSFAPSIFNHVPAGALVLWGDGQIQRANTEACKMLGVSAKVLISQRIDEALVPFEDVVRVARDRTRGEVLLQIPGGARLFGYTARYGDAQTPLVVLFQDLTDMHGLREERDRLLRMATVGEVLPTILHELRNPLAAVTSAVEVLLEDVAEGTKADALSPTLTSVLSELRRMSLVFDGIGIVGRKLRTHTLTAVDRAVAETVRTMGGWAARDQVALIYEQRALPRLPFEHSVIRALVFNLVANAIQACTVGDRIEIQATLQSSMFVLQVSDTGKGMDPEVLEQCTRAFFSTRPNGSGLGLVICRKAVEEAGGRFTIQSQLGEGTTVRVVIPSGLSA